MHELEKKYIKLLKNEAKEYFNLMKKIREIGESAEFEYKRKMLKIQNLEAELI